MFRFLHEAWILCILSKIQNFDKCDTTLFILCHVISKVQIFWECHTIWKNLPLRIWRYSVTSNLKLKIFSNLWHSQNIRTLIGYHFLAFWRQYYNYIKFIYFEKATQFCEISPVNLTGTTWDKSTVEILQKKILAFSEYMNFT